MKTNYDFEQLLSYLPDGWEEKAKELGAITRSRKIKNTADLLRLNLLYLTSGRSFGQTSAMLKLTTEQGLNKNAVYERVKKSSNWLKWLATEVCRMNGYLGDKPDWLSDFRVCLVDATDEAKRGSKGADYQLHYCMDLFTLNLVEMHLTDIPIGETISNFKQFCPGDLILADRAYSSLKAIRHLSKYQSDFVLRWRSNTFTLYDETGTKLSLPTLLEDLEEQQCRSLQLFCKQPKGLTPVRICIMRKSKEAEEKGLESIKNSNNKKMRGKVSDIQSQYNRYIIVMTSLSEEYSAKQILELYRARWQIEFVFKRLKSIFNYDEMPSASSEAIQSWFYGKLLLAGLCQAMVNHGRFSPSGNI